MLIKVETDDPGLLGALQTASDWTTSALIYSQPLMHKTLPLSASTDPPLSPPWSERRAALVSTLETRRRAFLCSCRVTSGTMFPSASLPFPPLSPRSLRRYEGDWVQSCATPGDGDGSWFQNHNIIMTGVSVLWVATNPPSVPTKASRPPPKGK